MLYFAYAATWNLLDSAGNPLFAALWGGVALAVPVTAEIARRSGTRRGLRRAAVLRRVALTTIGVALPMVMLLGILSAGT
jgi:hypothetical protein